MSVVRSPKSGLVDLVAIRRCDRAFDALAARRDAHCDDRVVHLLTALAADVDTGLPASRAPFAEPGPADERHTSPTPIRAIRGPSGRRGRYRARLVGARAALTASVAVAALTTTGVAAARIGTFESVERVLGISEQTAEPSELAADRVTDAVTTARRQIDQGHYPAARESIRLAWRHWADVRGEKAVALAGTIERLQARLARETAVSSAQSTPGGSGNHRGALPVPAPGTGYAAGSSLPETPGGATGYQGKTSDRSQEEKAKDRAVPSAGDATGDVAGKLPAAAEGGSLPTTGPLSGVVEDGFGDDDGDTDGESETDALGARSGRGPGGGPDAAPTAPMVRANKGPTGQKDLAATAGQ